MPSATCKAGKFIVHRASTLSLSQHCVDCRSPPTWVARIYLSPFPLCIVPPGMSSGRAELLHALARAQFNPHRFLWKASSNPQNLGSWPSSCMPTTPHPSGLRFHLPCSSQGVVTRPASVSDVRREKSSPRHRAVCCPAHRPSNAVRQPNS